jgi:hypothetical protein
MTLIEGIVASVTAAIIIAIAAAAYRKWFGQQIKITDPRPHELLTDPVPLGGGYSFPVRGTLKHLPKDHEIWLLVQNEATGQLWPQGHFRVEHKHGTWMGRINAMGQGNVKIFAVIAPPTSQDLFWYFQMLGPVSGYKPIERIPPECRKQDSVQAKVPRVRN